MSESERELSLFPLEQVVLFPGMPLPLRIFEERYKFMIGACQVTDQLFGVLLIRQGLEVGEPAVPERVGCTARMVRVDRHPDGRMTILTIGETRFRLRGQARVAPEGYLLGDVQLLDENATPSVDADLVSRVTGELTKYEQSVLQLRGSTEAGAPPEPPKDPVRLSYRVGASLHIHPRERQHLLEIDDLTARLTEELKLLRRENQPSAGTIGPFSVN
jgi:Lon protease-like protein